MKEQEEINIKVRNTTKYTILMNFMVVILNRGLDSDIQLLSDDSNIYQNMWDFSIFGGFYLEGCLTL